MRISDSLSFPFRGVNAWPNFGFLLVCYLIPIIGPIVAMGYHANLERSLSFDIQGEPPRFDFGKFGTYLQRGVAPFVVSLIAVLGGLMLIGGLFVLLVLGAAASKSGPDVMVALLLAGGALGFLAMVVLGVVMIPMVFRAGVEQSIGAAFQTDFVLAFLKHTGWLALWSKFVLTVVTLPLMVIMCIPVVQYAVFPWITLVQSHLNVQLYHVYLERGGTPLYIVPDEPVGAFPVIQSGHEATGR